MSPPTPTRAPAHAAAAPYDLVVVGAGPAGSAAALAALQAWPQARVALVDAATFPRDKACGDGIAPHAVAELARLGVHDAVTGFPPVSRLRLRTPLDREVVAELDPPSYVVPRSVFDARLVEAAAARGAHVIRHRVRELVRHADRVTVGDGLSARVVIAADGANSTLRRLLGASPNPPWATAVAIRGYAPMPPGAPEQLIAMVAEDWPAYAWSFPIDGPGFAHRANIGFGMLRSSLDGRSRQALVEPLGALLPDQPAAPETLRAHHLPLSTWRPRQPDGRVLLVGDAASLINPLTGEGIYYAVLSGRLAGEAAVAALRGETSTSEPEPGSAYRRALRRELGRHLATTSALARLVRSPELFDAGVGLAGRDPAAMSCLVEMGLGRGTLPPRLLARLLRRIGPSGAISLLQATAAQVRPFGRRRGGVGR